MNVQSVYLDTNAIVKRYLVEEGSELVDELYDKAHSGEVLLGFSLWNIGEVAVVLDKYERRGVLGSARDAFSKFVGETRFLIRINQLRLMPLSLGVLFTATKYVFKYGIYVADAIQLSSARDFHSFLTYDRGLAGIATMEGLNALNI